MAGVVGGYSTWNCVGLWSDDRFLEDYRNGGA